MEREVNLMTNEERAAYDEKDTGDLLVNLRNYKLEDLTPNALRLLNNIAFHWYVPMRGYFRILKYYCLY